MKVSTESVATREVELTVEPDDQSVRKAMRQAAKEISRHRPIAGYRPGKAPYALVERMYGAQVILNEALDDLGNDVYRQALQEAAIEPFASGSMDVASQEPLVIKFRVPLMPVVTLGDYATIKVDPEPEVAITEEQIDEQVAQVQRRHAEHTPIEDRPAALGDQVVAAIKGEAEGETVVNRQSSAVDLNDELMPPGFAEALVGMAKDETRQFSLAYPDDYEDTELAGKNVDFTVTVSTIREVRLPAIDDDLAKQAGDYETLDDLRQTLAENLKRRLEAQARARESSAAVEALVAMSQVEYPDAALQQKLDGAIRNQANQLQQMGFTWERYLQMVGQTEEEIREQLRPEMESELARRLVVGEFAQAEKLNVDPSELTDELTALSRSLYASYGERANQILENMNGTGVIMGLYADVLSRKAIKRLTDMATGRPLDEIPDETAEEATEAISQAVPEEPVATVEEASASEGGEAPEQTA